MFHANKDYRNEATDGGEELGAHALRRRALKVQRDEHVKAREGNQTRMCAIMSLNFFSLSVFAAFYGERARYLYFQCQQLILRQQISTLIKLWDLPPEFEVSFGSWQATVISA
jgi:RNA polymerase I-specific transcription initiation factor RRN7